MGIKRLAIARIDTISSRQSIPNRQSGGRCFVLKWLLILFGGAVLIVVAIFGFFVFATWNFERGYPKSVLVEELKGTCVVSKKTFALVKARRDYMGAKVFDFLPKPTGIDYIYDSYLPGTITKEDGSEAYDLSDAVVLLSLIHI